MTLWFRRLWFKLRHPVAFCYKHRRSKECYQGYWMCDHCRMDRQVGAGHLWWRKAKQ